MRFTRFIPTICFLLCLAGGIVARAQEHPPQTPPVTGQGTTMPKGAQPTEPHDDEHAAKGGEEEHTNPVIEMGAKILNFALLVGALVYFLKSPIAAHLAGRITQIRQDLVTAADLKKTASAQLAEIQQKVAALPAELEALRRQGAEDVKAERARIAAAAENERVRLLDQTRREIDMRLRVAKRELTEHAAQLAVQVAEQRIKRVITPDDQIRLVDRYATQLKEAR
jgi:F-type H+-transporting ATPase subunit b